MKNKDTGVGKCGVDTLSSVLIVKKPNYDKKTYDYKTNYCVKS